MPVYICMLRGVNVGGKNIIKMDELRKLFDSIGLKHALTYIQSGNIVFAARQSNAVKIEAQIEASIEKQFGFRPKVMLRAQSELTDLIARNPFAGRAGIDPAKLGVTFLSIDPGSDARRKVREIKLDPEELVIEGRELFIYFPLGMGKSKLPWALLDRTLGTQGTTRNWNTVVKLSEMASSLSPL